ncbi:hypothetical protein AB0392_60515 [Nonomuraea angiospora]|uniref:hypothetical protein n=1 Tax=Nonomuraea angiospora TaxID=46172 RepID=UPI00344BD177
MGVVGERLEFSGTFGADGIVFPRTIITVSRKVVSPDGTVTSKALPRPTGRPASPIRRPRPANTSHVVTGRVAS